ncbi:MAG: GtrA family protein [Lachnospiraceae bacterium]|nr:GtrA family protein [Lachnospiraceae bacterium]MCI9149565.1 GtrA family protein [Lachnospiraceae bacterium]
MKKMFDLAGQLIKFGIVGVISTALDYGLMVLFTEGFGIFYLLSSTLSYAISLIFNYFASMKFVFRSREDMGRLREFVTFTLLCLMGMGLNQLILWLIVEKCGIYYMISKILATVVVMIWNFVTRKIFLEERDITKKI